MAKQSLKTVSLGLEQVKNGLPDLKNGRHPPFPNVRNAPTHFVLFQDIWSVKLGQRKSKMA